MKKIFFYPFYVLFLLNKFFSKLLRKFNMDFTKWQDLNSRYFFSLITSVSFNCKKNKRCEIKFFIPNTRTRQRADTLLTKEKDTIKWINDLEEGTTLYDIGSNVGIYSVYFLAINKGSIVCFEPSFSNLMLLSKNINLNKFDKRCVVISNPLYKINTIKDFTFSTDDFGHSGASVNDNYAASLANFSIQTMTTTLDHLHDEKILTKIPGAIKIDVDGNEEKILRGGKKVISNKNCKTIIIENIHANSNIEALLLDAGFKNNFNDYESITSNQIWIK